MILLLIGFSLPQKIYKMGIICLELDDLMKDKLGEINNYKSD